MALFALLGHPVFARDGDHAIGHRIASFHGFAYVDARGHEAEIDQCLHLCGMSIDTFWRIKRDCPDLVFSCFSLYSVVGRGAINDLGCYPDFITCHEDAFDAIVLSRGFTKELFESKYVYSRGSQEFEFNTRAVRSIIFDGFIVAWPRIFIFGEQQPCLVKSGIYKPHEIYAKNILQYIEDHVGEIDRTFAQHLCANENINFNEYWEYALELKRVKQRRRREDKELAELRKRARR